MKYAIAASMMALGLAACGGGGGAKSEMVKACMDEGGTTKEVCECQAGALIDAIGEDKAKEMVALGKKDEAAAAEMMMKLATDDPTAAMKMGEAMMACGT